MPKKNNKDTQNNNVSFSQICGYSFKELFHPDSPGRLFDYDGLKLIDVNQLKLVDHRHLNLLHIPTLAFFVQYVGAFALTLTLMFGLFFSYALMTVPGAGSDPVKFASAFGVEVESEINIESRTSAQVYTYVQNTENIATERGMRVIGDVEPGAAKTAQAAKVNKVEPVIAVNFDKPREESPIIEPIAQKVESTEASGRRGMVVLSQDEFAALNGVEVEEEKQLASAGVVVLSPKYVEDEYVENNDQRIYDVYDIDENSGRAIALANTGNVLGTQDVVEEETAEEEIIGTEIPVVPTSVETMLANIDRDEYTTPACSFSYKDSKYSSGSSLYVSSSDKTAKVCVDYTSSATRSVARVNSEVSTTGGDFVNCISLEELSNIETVSVDVMDSGSNYIGSCHIDVAVSKVRDLASL